MAAVTKPDKMLGERPVSCPAFFRAFPELRRDIMETEQTFTRGPILSTLLKFALPVLLALLLQAMYGAVDLQVVGKFGTAADISAVSTGSQIMQTVTIVITGLAMGITVLLGQKIGEDRPEEAGAAVGSGICLFLVVAVAATVALELAAPQLAMLMHAPADAFDGTVEYVRICSGGAVFIVAYNLLGSIFRGIGDSRVPLITVLIACILNIGGDLLLVGGFGLNVAGAAIATVFAQAMSVALSLLLIRGKHLAFILRRQDIRFNGAIIGRILKLGSPVALQDLLVNITFLVIIAIANSMGTIPSAGVGVAEKLCAFVMLVPSAYMQSMSAISISWICWYSQSLTGTEMPCLAASRRMMPANSSTSLFRWFLPSCRIEVSPLEGRWSMMSTHAATSFSESGTPSALATAATSRMAPIMVSRGFPGTCSGP